MTAIRGVDVYCDICERSMRTCSMSVMDARKVCQKLGWKYDRNKAPTDVCYDCHQDVIPEVEAARVRDEQLTVSLDLEMHRPRLNGLSILSLASKGGLG